MCSWSWPEQDTPSRQWGRTQPNNTHMEFNHRQPVSGSSRPTEKGRGIPEALIIGQSHYHLIFFFFLSGEGARVRQDRSQCTPTLPLEKKSPLPHHPSCCTSGVWETSTHGPNGTAPCLLSIKCSWNTSYGRSVAAFKPQCKSGDLVRETTWTVTSNRKSLQKPLQKSVPIPGLKDPRILSLL